jgi:hypothetical protein
MAATYRLGIWRRFRHVVARALLRVGFEPRHTYLSMA